LRLAGGFVCLTPSAEIASFASMANTLWVGTRKGLFALRGKEGRRDWNLVGPQFLGHVTIMSCTARANRTAGV
jgi:ligand-binding sensor domain-containing protein